MSELKKAVIINSLSCYGKSSITVALPILSAAEIETTVIPTALFSTHTGIKDFVFTDVTSAILPTAEHLNSLKIQFDAIGLGYLANKEQILAASKAIDLLSKENTTVVIDPIMGENGKLYKRFTKTFPKYMLDLCKKANVITPNITEACLLADVPFKAEYDEEYIADLAIKLYEKIGAKVVITGISFDERKIGVAVYGGENVKYVFCDKVPTSYHGSGDIFSAGLLASLLNERGLRAAAEIAQNFVCGCIKSSFESGAPEKSGIIFEKKLNNIRKYLEI